MAKLQLCNSIVLLMKTQSNIIHPVVFFRRDVSFRLKGLLNLTTFTSDNDEQAREKEKSPKRLHWEWFEWSRAARVQKHTLRKEPGVKYRGFVRCSLVSPMCWEHWTLCRFPGEPLRDPEVWGASVQGRES